MWIVKLSNGEIKHHSGEELPTKTWLRLKNKVINEQLAIENMVVQVEDNVIVLPEKADGYFFGLGSVAVFGGPQFGSVIAGYLDKQIRVTKYALPNLIPYEETSVSNLDDPRLIKSYVECV